MKIYQVGGAVRDKLLGLEVKDKDWVVVGSAPEEMESLGYKSVGKDFPVFLHPETHEEYALARTERKTAPGYKGFVFSTSKDVTLEGDLKRRDLTINAIVEDEDGNLFDPFNGRSDLEAGILRHVSSAFVEDPVRVLRIARFAARFGFSVAEETNILMKKISSSGELNTLVAERVWQETEKVLAEQDPVQFFKVLRNCGALQKIFPEIDVLWGIPQPEHYHPEIDTGVHTMMVLEQACKLSEDTCVRFSALVHDLGKGKTSKSKWPNHNGHDEGGVSLINQLCDHFRIPKKYCELAALVSRYHLDCHRIGKLKATTVVKKLESLDAFRRPERFQQFLLACEADARGREGLEKQTYPQAKLFNELFQSAVNVATDKLESEGLNGKEMANVIHELRVKAVKKARLNDATK